MHRPNKETVARWWNAPAKQRNDGAVMECTGQTKKRRRADGMHRPNKETAARWWNAPAKREGEFAQFMEHHLRREELEHHLRREELERDDFEQELSRNWLQAGIEQELDRNWQELWA
jgi:hypothetical protein